MVECDKTPLFTYNTPVADNAGDPKVEVAPTGNPPLCRDYVIHLIVTQPWGHFMCHEYEDLAEHTGWWKIGVGIAIIGGLALCATGVGMALGAPLLITTTATGALGSATGVGSAVLVGTAATITTGVTVVVQNKETTKVKGALIRDFGQDYPINGTMSRTTRVYTSEWHACAEEGDGF